MSLSLLIKEDAEIAAWFTQEFARKYAIRFQTEVQSVSNEQGRIMLRLKQRPDVLIADQVLVSTGR